MAFNSSSPSSLTTVEYAVLTLTKRPSVVITVTTSSTLPSQYLNLTALTIDASLVTSVFNAVIWSVSINSISSTCGRSISREDASNTNIKISCATSFNSDCNRVPSSESSSTFDRSFSKASSNR